MASVVELVMAQAIQSQSPEHQMTRDWMAAQNEKTRAEVIVLKSETVNTINSKLTEALANGSDPEVIATYRQLLAETAKSR